jgi:S-adenosylmethionine decarboxylase proenzyme
MGPTDTRSVHLLVELRNCGSLRLDDEDHVVALMRAAAVAARATVVQAAVHHYAPQGVAGVLLLAESHMSVHTWPEHAYVSVDVYTCGGCDPDLAIPVLAEGFGAARVELTRVVRGLEGAPEVTDTVVTRR